MRCPADDHGQPSERRVPVFVNPSSGSAEKVVSALEGDARICLRSLPAEDLGEAIAAAAEQGADRVIVCGGDGTLALAAARLARRDTALAVVPGGTLNHFATHLQLPVDPLEALELALTGKVRSVAAAYVNDRLFLNTSAVGAYVHFVRSRNQLQRELNYPLATLLAGFRRLTRFRSARVRLDGSLLRTPLVFVGVNERELGFPLLGERKPDGSSGLHLIAVKSQGPLESLKIAFKAIIRGVDPLERAREVENCLLDQLELGYHKARRRVTVAVDGELVPLDAPLQYRYEPEALRVIAPSG